MDLTEINPILLLASLTVAAMHVTAQGQHHFGGGAALGVTLF